MTLINNPISYHSRPMGNVRGLTYQTLIEVTANIESQEMRRCDNSRIGYAEHQLQMMWKASLRLLEACSAVLSCFETLSCSGEKLSGMDCALYCTVVQLFFKNCRFSY
jgi:hypothetical protein